MARIGWLVIVAWVLAGCGEEPGAGSEGAGPAEAKPSAPEKRADAPGAAEAEYGTYRKNDTVMPVRDHVYRWVADENKLVVIQTPSRLAAKEREALGEGESDFLVLMDNKSPDDGKWAWYPWVVTEIRFASSEVRADNIERFYIKAYGIERKNHTDNINAGPGDNAVFERVDLDDGELTLEYSGTNSIVDDRHRWDIALGEADPR